MGLLVLFHGDSVVPSLICQVSMLRLLQFFHGSMALLATLALMETLALVPQVDLTLYPPPLIHQILSQPPPLTEDQQESVQFQTGRETAGVTMRTTMLHATMMVVIVVLPQTATLTRIPIVTTAPAWILLHQNLRAPRLLARTFGLKEDVIAFCQGGDVTGHGLKSTVP